MRSYLRKRHKIGATCAREDVNMWIVCFGLFFIGVELCISTVVICRKIACWMSACFSEHQCNSLHVQFFVSDENSEGVDSDRFSQSRQNTIPRGNAWLVDE